MEISLRVYNCYNKGGDTAELTAADDDIDINKDNNGIIHAVWIDEIIDDDDDDDDIGDVAPDPSPDATSAPTQEPTQDPTSDPTADAAAIGYGIHICGDDML